MNEKYFRCLLILYVVLVASSIFAGFVPGGYSTPTIAESAS